MLLTEEEATSRWCPFARVALGGRLPTSMNRVQEIGRVNDDATVTRGAVTLPGGAYCIASKCMAWAPQPEKKILLVKMNADTPWEQYSWDPRNSERERDKRDYATAEYRDIVERVGSCGLCSQSGERLAKAGGTE